MSKQEWGAGSVYLRGRTWWISYPCNGVQKKESAKTPDEAKARKFLRSRMAEIQKFGLTGPEIAKVRVNELLDDLVEDYRNNNDSADWCEAIVRNHLRPAFGMLRASAVGTDHLKNYIRDRRAAKAKPATINNELALLKRSFNLGAGHEPPKVLRVPKIKMLEANNVRKGFFTIEHLRALQAHLPKEIAAVVTFAFWTGCRIGEILNLKWSQYDAAAKVIRLNPGETKNDDARILPLVGELHDLIVGLKLERDRDWRWSRHIFSRAGKQIVTFRRTWLGAVAALDLPAHCVHDFRRSGLQNLVRAGTPEKVAMKISGHRTRKTFERYQIVREDDLHAAMQNVADYIKKQEGGQ